MDGKDCKVNKEVERVLKEFHGAKKPIGLCCIAPVLAAKVIKGVEVTVGHEQEEGASGHMLEPRKPSKPWVPSTV